MASVSQPLDSLPEPPRKKIKTSDLPLPSATRASIESLAHTFKKKGGYDSLRKQVWDSLVAGGYENELVASVTKIAEEEVERQPSLLSQDRGKAALLLEGVIERTSIYQDAETHIKKLIEDHMDVIEKEIRDIRKQEVSEEVAAAEELKGKKTDEQYSEEAAMRRREREKVREELREKERAIVEEKKKLEKAKRREEERKREAEEAKRRAEREARRKAEREAEGERERLREKDRSRDRPRSRDHDRDVDMSHDRRLDTGRRDERRDSREPLPKPKLSREEAERLEQEALDLLMREGKRVSQRSRYQLEPEVDETLAPPPRKSMPASAIKPISRDPPAKPLDVKKELLRSTAGDNRRNSIADDYKRDDRDRRRRSRSHSRGLERDRDRNYVRRDSRDRDARPRRSSRDRDDSRDRRDRSRVRPDSKDKERDYKPRRESKDRDDRRRRDSRDRDDRRRRDSRDRDDRRRRDSRERDDNRTRDRSRTPRDERRSYRDRECDRERRRSRTPPRRDFKTLEEKKQEAVKQRELEAKEYLAKQREAREKGLPIPGLDKPRIDGFARPNWGGHREDATHSRKRDSEPAGLHSPTAPKKREGSRDMDSRARSPSRASSVRDGSRADRASSPLIIDRYVPGGGTVRRESVSVRSDTAKRERSRSRDRERERDRERDRDRDRDSRRRRDELRESGRHTSKAVQDDGEIKDDARSIRRRSRSRSRSRSRRRDRSREGVRGKERPRSRTRSPPRRKDTGRRDRTRSRSRDRDTSRRYRSRSRDRDRGRDDRRSRKD